jgi:hypothetical protein
MNCPTSAREAKERAFRLAIVLGIETSGIWSSFLTNWEVLGWVRGGGQSEPTRDLKATTSSRKFGGGSRSRFSEAMGDAEGTRSTSPEIRRSSLRG